MVKYQKCSDLKRTFAFLIDIFIAFLIGVVLFTIPSLIFQQTDSYKNNLETINAVKKESGLFKNDQNLDIYLENEDLTIKERYEYLDNAIKNFYKNSNFFSEDKKAEYDLRKKDAVVDDKNLFILEDGEYVNSMLNISDNEYYAFYKNEYYSYALPSLSSIVSYKDANQNILSAYNVILIVSALVSLFIVFFLIPIFEKRNRSTIGMKIFKIGLISNSGFALSIKEFVFRFLFLYCVELILGFFSFLIIPFISFSMMIFGNKHEPFHDLLINSRAIDVSNSIIYLDEYDFNIKNS